MSTTWSILFTCAGVGVVAVASVPALANIGYHISKKDRRREDGSLYHDKDGTATEASQQEFSSRVQCIVLSSVIIGGSGISLSAAVLRMSQKIITRKSPLAEKWLGFLTWVLLLIQTGNIFVEKRSVNRFNFASINAVCCCILALILCVTDTQNLTLQEETFRSAEVILLLLAFVTCITFPRRPDVYHDGGIVDRQWGVSALNRLTYSWCSPLLALISARHELTLADLPSMDHYARSRALHDAFSRQSKKESLAKALILSHTPAFVWQYLFTLIASIFLVAPQLAMYNLLRLLETRDAGVAVTYKASMWVIGLGLGMLIQSFLDNRIWWISSSQLQIPIHAQLSALIFTKSMRRRDVEDGREVDAFNKRSNDDFVDDGITWESNTKNSDTDEILENTSRGTINLVGVDAERVSGFSASSNWFFGSACELVVSFTFLGKLLGWQSLLSGIAAQLLCMPLNIYFSKRYIKVEEELMTVRDRKLAILSETLTSIRQIKFSALEHQWQAKIREIRRKELRTLWRAFIADTFLIFCYLAGPVMLSAVSLIVYATIHKSLSASVAFTTIAILGQIEGTLGMIPELTTNLIDAWVSCKRIQEYLDAPEKPKNTTPGDSICFRHASIAWPSERDEDEKFALRDLDLEFPNQELTVISGCTGSGKSLLLAAIIGEVDVLSGIITVPATPPIQERYDDRANTSNWVIPSALAFISQQPWVENCTFRDNIVFGLPYDEGRYRKVITACALDKDLQMMTNGDMTEIGPSGINLSGGQRWRVTLARALYSRAGILVLDDIFSAVDTHVGKHIFEQALVGELGIGRTRILATHHVSLCLPKTKYEVRIGKGKVDYAGLVEIMQRPCGLRNMFEEEVETGIAEDEQLQTSGHGESKLRHRYGLARRRSSVTSDSERGTLKRSSRSSFRERRASLVSIRSDKITVDTKPKAKKFVEEETKQTGKVTWAVYKQYMSSSGGIWFWSVVLLTFGGYQGLLLARSWWIAIWTERYGSKPLLVQQAIGLFNSPSKSLFSSPPAQPDSDLWFYLAVYLGLSIIISLEGSLRYLWVYRGSLKASQRLFDKLMHTVLHAPLRWLDTVPVGRILNRFTTDFNAIDSELGSGIAFMLYHLLKVLGVVIAGIIVNPLMIVVAMILLAFCIRYSLYYLSGAREAKRLGSVTKSPIFELFRTTLSGIDTIRAFGRTDVYINNMFSKIDAHSQTLWYMCLFDQWLTWRLGFIGVIFSIAMAVLIVSFKAMSASLAGFALGFTLQYADAVVWMLQQYVDVELGMNAAERIVEYSEIHTEDEGGADAPAVWPTKGCLEVSDLVVSYAPDLPPVLKGLSFRVEPNERVGVVGRTGAGKSSLTLALFRFLEASQGSIHIDGLDISKIKLHDLRSRLAIIPQDPVLFTGTIRSNIDPFSEHRDQELEDALERVHIKLSLDDNNDNDQTSNEGIARNPDSNKTATKNINTFASLTFPIREGGQNLSQGQRQLLCLARAIISHPKIMILDEATSAVDKLTDELIQRSIRAEFMDSTLLVIAHRLSTIADFDRILVMGEGRVMEFDTPRNLVERGGMFAEMIADSGEATELREAILRKGR